MKNDESWFWSLIKEHVVHLDDAEIDAAPLLEALKRLPAEQILAFERLFFARYAESYTEALWGAAYVIHGGCSDDTFDYFRGWLIGQGQKVFERALKNPDSLSRVVKVAYAADELMCCIAQDAYEQSTSKPLPELPYEYPELERTLDFEDWDAMQRAYPKLCKKFDPDELIRMERPWRGEELLDRCRVIAGSRQKKWDYLYDTDKFLHRFRPVGQDSNGSTLRELIGDFPLGEETARRIIATIKVDGGTDGKLKANRTRRITKEAAKKLLLNGFENACALAKEPGAERETAEPLLAVERVVMPPRGGKFGRPNQLTFEARKELEMVGRFAIHQEAVVTPSVSMLDGAVYGLVDDEAIAHHIMWPRCEGMYQVSEPFEPLFELWRAGATWRLLEPGVAELQLP